MRPVRRAGNQPSRTSSGLASRVCASSATVGCRPRFSKVLAAGVADPQGHFLSAARDVDGPAGAANVLFQLAGGMVGIA